MALERLGSQVIGWRWWAAGLLFLCGFIGLLADVGLSERADLAGQSWLPKAYYALGFFVFGGLDVGVPVGGPDWARAVLWFAYFGAPALTASAVIETVVNLLTPDNWELRRISDHTVVFGSGRLAVSYLRVMRRFNPDARVVVVDTEFDPVREQELRQRFAAVTVVGTLTHEYLLRTLRLTRARRVLLLADDDFQSFEAAARILELAPRLSGRIVLHCHNLRFMRALQTTDIAQQCEVFNTYHLAASGFVRNSLVEHFERTNSKDIVVMAGFGRFGQSVLEELHAVAADEIAEVAVIDRDAARRVLVVDEQEKIMTAYERNVFQGDISHPEVWRQLTEQVDLGRDSPTVVLGTGQEQENLRTALWLKQRYPNAAVYARTNDISRFALSVGAERAIHNISITELVEQHIPQHWLTPK